jgi:hypothetical protein
MLIDVNPWHPKGSQIPVDQIVFVEFIDVEDGNGWVEVTLKDGTFIQSELDHRWEGGKELRQWLKMAKAVRRERDLKTGKHLCFPNEAKVHQVIEAHRRKLILMLREYERKERQCV